jgi:uncharacterized protein
VDDDRAGGDVTSAFTAHQDHLRLAIRLTPNAAKDAVEALETSDDGQTWLKARVTAVPEDGKANKALVQLLAKWLKTPKSSISILSGETARKKILRIDGEPEDLMKKIDTLLKR